MNVWAEPVVEVLVVLVCALLVGVLRRRATVVTRPDGSRVRVSRAELERRLDD